jgi:TrwC relaxase
VVITTAVITPTPTPRWSGSATSPGRWRLTGPWPAPYPTWALIYARTRHTTSRAGDPAPHDHIMVTNCCEMLAGKEWVQGLDSAALQKVVGGGHDGRPPARCGQGPVVGLRTRRCVQGVWPTCRRWATSLGWGLRPSRMARHGGHSHQSGRAAGCRVGSPSNSNRHRPHCWGGGPLSAGTQRVLGSGRCRSAPPTRVSGKCDMMPPLVGVLRGGIGLVRPEAGSGGANEATPPSLDPVEQAG